MARIHMEYKDKNVILLALNVLPQQFPVAQFMAYMRRYGGGDHVYASDEGQKVVVAYGVQYLGETVFIGRDGKITSRAFPPGLSYEELKQAVDQLLQ